MAKDEEPKPILAIYRLLETLSSNHHVINWSGRTQNAVINLMSDPRSFEISNVNVRMRVNMLDRLQVISRFSTDDRLVRNC